VIMGSGASTDKPTSATLSLKGKTKDFERLEQNVKNQNLLEEELSSVQAKLKLALHELEAARAFETTNQVLIAEKRQWSTLFADTIKVEPTESEVISSSDINPLVVLKAYTNLQEKYAISIKINGEIESKNGDLLRKLKESEESINSKTVERGNATQKTSLADLFCRLPDEAIAHILWKFLRVQDLARLDVALCTHHRIRRIYLESLRSNNVSKDETRFDRWCGQISYYFPGNFPGNFSRGLHPLSEP